MINEQSRISRISDRNIYLNTDRLYDPLRNTLRKSTVSPTQRIVDISPTKIGRKMHSLSPAQAENIKSSIFIPINQQLKPTAGVDKIMGKTFTAVDAVQKYGEPISELQMSRVKRGAVQEIVYEVQGNQGNGESIYTSRNGFPVQPAVSRIVEFPQRSTKRPSVTFNSVTSGFNRTASPVPINIPQVRVSSPSPPTVSMAPVKVQASPPPMNMTPARVQSPPPINMNMTPVRVSSPPPMNMTPIRVQSPPIQMLPAKSMTAITSLRNQTNASQLKSSSNSNLYDFKGSTVSDRGARLSRLRKDQYKYNLFSMLDEPGNSGCKAGCCTHGNEIVASRIENNPWR